MMAGKKLEGRRCASGHGKKRWISWHITNQSLCRRMSNRSLTRLPERRAPDIRLYPGASCQESEKLDLQKSLEAYPRKSTSATIIAREHSTECVDKSGHQRAILTITEDYARIHGYFGTKFQYMERFTGIPRFFHNVRP